MLIKNYADEIGYAAGAQHTPMIHFLNHNRGN